MKTNNFWLMLVCCIGMLTACQQQPTQVQTQRATVLPEGRVIEKFSLSHFKNGTFSNDNLKDQWSLFFFGYTRCPDVCPTELFTLSQMMEKLDKHPTLVERKPQVVFVSVDPQQDSLENLHTFVSYFYPDFLGITGQQEKVDAFARNMGAFHQRVYYKDGKILPLDSKQPIPETLKNDYLINHSATIFVVNPEGQFHAVFSHPHEVDVLIQDLQIMQEAWS